MSGGMASLPLVAALALVAFLGCHQTTSAAGIGPEATTPQLAPVEAGDAVKGTNATEVDGSSDLKTPRLLDTSTHVEIINDNSQLNKNDNSQLNKNNNSRLNKNPEEPEAEPEPDTSISGGQDDQEAIQEVSSDQDPLADDYSSDPSGAKDGGADGGEDYLDEGEEEGGETSQNSRTRTRGGASSRRTLSTLMRKRAQQQRGGNREQAAERAQAYYERHGVHVLTEQKEETKPGTKRYKLRNKPPPSRLQERRRQQLERNKERQAQKEQHFEEFQADPLDEAVEETPKVDRTRESNPDESGGSAISQSLSRREQLSQKRKLKKQQQEQQRKQQLEEKQDQQKQEQEQVEEEIIQPVGESQVQNAEQNAQNDSKSIVQEKSNQSEMIADVVPEMKAEKLANDLAKIPLQEKNEQQKQSEDEMRRKRLEIRERLMMMRQKQQQGGDEMTPTDQETQTVLEQILSLRSGSENQESGSENQEMLSDENEEIRRVHQQVLLEQLEQLNKKMQEEHATSSVTAEITASAVQSAQTPQGEVTSLPPTLITESTNDTTDVLVNISEPDTQPGTDSAPEDHVTAAEELVDDVPKPETQPGNDSAPEDQGNVVGEIIADISEPETQPGIDSEPAEDLEKAADEIVADAGVESAVVSAQKTEPSASDGDASEGEEDKPSDSSPKQGYQRPTFKRPFFQRPASSTSDTGDAKTEGVLQGTSRLTVPPPRGRPSLFRRNNTKTTTVGTPQQEPISEGTASTPASAQQRPLPFGIANSMRIKRPTLFRDTQKEETISTEPTVAQEVVSSTTVQAGTILNRANSKFKDPEFVERPQVFHIRKSSNDEEALMDGQNLHNLTLDEASELYPANPHLQYIEDNPDEIFQFEDTILEEVTLDYLENISEGPFAVTTFDVTAQETQGVNEIPLSETKGPMTWTTVMLNSEDATTVSPKDEEVTDNVADEFVTRLDHESTLKNEKETSEIDETTEEITTDSIHANTTLKDTEPTQFATSIFTEQETISDTEDPILTTTQISSVLSTEVTTTTTKKSSAFTARPFRYSLYNKRPGSKLQEIMSRRTAPTVAPTATVPAETETMTQTVTESVQKTDPETIHSIPTVDETSPTEGYETSEVDESESTTESSGDRLGARFELKQSNKLSTPEVPVAASTLVTVTTGPVTYVDHSSRGDEHHNNIIGTSTEKPILNIADEIEQMNIFHRSEGDTAKQDVNSTNELNDYEILGAIKNVIASSSDPSTTSSSIAQTVITDNTDEIANESISAAMDESLADEIANESISAAVDESLGDEIANESISAAVDESLADEIANESISSAVDESLADEIANESISAAVDESLTKDDEMYSDDPVNQEDYYEYYHMDSGNVTDANFEYVSDYGHTNQSSRDSNTTIVPVADGVNNGEARNYGIDVTNEHNNSDYYDSDIAGKHNTYDYYYDYADTENSTAMPATTEIVLTANEPHLADPQDLSEISDMPEGVAILTDGFFYPNQPAIEEKTLEENTPSDRSQADLTMTEPPSRQHTDTESLTPTHASPFVPREEVKVSTGFLIKDIPYTDPEKLYGATDIEVNQVRTDRKNTLNSQENSQLQEMMIQNENDPSAPPVKLLVSNNFGRISAGDQDTFDISVSSSLFTGGDSEPKQHIRVGQVIPVEVDQDNSLNSDAEERQEAREAGESGPVVDKIEEQPAENDEELGVGIGQVIPVDLTEEEKVTGVGDEVNDIPPPPPLPPTSAPSFLGTLFNMFTRPERPKPRPRPNRPDRPRPLPPRRFPNGTEIEEEDRPMRPPIFRAPRPNHPYRPFRPTGFRPPRPNLQPPLELESAIDTDSDGVSSVDSPLLHSAIRPDLEFENRPLFEPNPDDSSTPQLVDRSRPPFAGDRPSRLPFRPPFRPTGPLRPPPPPPFPMPIESIENEEETAEPTTLLPYVSSESDSSGTLDVKQTDLLPETEIVDVVEEESLDKNADPSASVDVKTMTISDITTEKITSIPPVIEIKGPLEYFINQLKDGPEMEKDGFPPEKTTEHSSTETTSTTTTTTKPVVTELRVSIETADSIIEKELSSNVSYDNLNELEITPPDDINESESATESLVMVKEDLLPVETDSMLELEISTDQPIILDQSTNTLQPELRNKIKLEPSTHILTPATVLEASSEHSTVVTKQSTTSSIEEEATPTIPLVEAIVSSTTELTTDSLTTTTTTTPAPLPTSPVDNKLIGEADSEEPQPKDEITNLDVDKSFLQDDFYDPPKSYDYVASDIEEDNQTSSTVSLLSTSTSTFVTPPEQRQTTSSIQEERYKPHGATSEKTTPHPYHNIPDGSFVSSSHLYSDSPDFSARIPRPRPTVVLPGSRPGLPIRIPTDFPKRPHFEHPRPLNQEVVQYDHQGPPPRPFIETGFQGLRGEERPKVDESVREEITIEAEEGPTLPPSLPNLQIIPFVAADAVKKADDNLAVESAPDDVREVVLPPDYLPGAPIPGQHELCWENGRILGNGVPVNYTKDACQSCRCYFGQLICQMQECQEVPAHCQGVMQPGECCPMIVCEHEIKEGESIPHNIDAVSEPSENKFIIPAESGDYPDDSVDYAREPSDYTEDGNEDYLLQGNQDDYTEDVDQKPKPIKPEMTTPSSSYPVHPASIRPPHADRFPESKKPFGDLETEDRRPLISNRFADSDKRPSLPFRNTPPVDRSDIPPLRRKPSAGGSRPTLPFILRNRPGGRPSFIPPRKPSFLLSTTTRFPSSTTERIHDGSLDDEIVPLDDGTVSNDDEVVSYDDERVLHADERIPEIEAVQHTSSTTSTTTEVQPLVVPVMSTTSKPFLSDLASFLEKVGTGDETRPNFLLPRPIQQTTALESAEIENLLLREDFQFGQDARPSGKPVKQPVKPVLPDIPESVKSQLPLGIDAIMASGMFQLSGCNIYGREYKVGEGIKELSATCKACRCTPVGVQCLPTC